MDVVIGHGHSLICICNSFVESVRLISDFAYSDCRFNSIYFKYHNEFNKSALKSVKPWYIQLVPIICEIYGDYETQKKKHNSPMHHSASAFFCNSENLHSKSINRLIIYRIWQSTVNFQLQGLVTILYTHIVVTVKFMFHSSIFQS